MSGHHGLLLDEAELPSFRTLRSSACNHRFISIHRSTNERLASGAVLLLRWALLLYCVGTWFLVLRVAGIV